MERARTKNGSAKAGQFVLAQSFSVGPLSIRIYGLTMALAIVVGYLVGKWRFNKSDIVVADKAKFFDDLVFRVVIVGFISARLYHVFTHWSDYQNNFVEIPQVWHGGLAIYGAIIGGTLALLYTAHKHKIRFLKLTDVAAIAMPVSQAIGRIGNFFNYELFGTPTNLPWKMYVPREFRPGHHNYDEYFHPTFAYEMLWNLGLFTLLLWVSAKYTKLKAGSVTAIYLMGYGVGRFWIEALRLDSTYIFNMKINQIASLLIFLLGLGILLKYASPQNNQ
jgi:phosphatidylglycerol---prolipoprotein diacylglyceryl transferase